MEPWIRVILVLLSIWCAMMWGFGAGKFSCTHKPDLPFKRDIMYWMNWGFMMASLILGLTAVLA